MVKLKLSLFRHRTRFFMKKKDKISGGRNNTNDFNGGGDGEKKKEKDPSKVQQIMKLLELEHTESDDGGITKSPDVASKADVVLGDWLEQMRLDDLVVDQSNNKTGLGGGDDGGDDDSNGDGDGNDDGNGGGGGGTNNKKGSDRDGDGNGDKYKSDRDSDSDGRGAMKGKNMDFMGKAGFGDGYGYHAGNENGYQVEQLQCAQEVQSSEPKCLSYHAIMIN